MSLICAHCGKIVVLSDHPDHLGGCGNCDLNENDRRRVQESATQWTKKIKELRK